MLKTGERNNLICLLRSLLLLSELEAGKKRRYILDAQEVGKKKNEGYLPF